MSGILPDFSQIVFVSHENRTKPAQPGETIDLWNLFNAMINNKPLEVDEKQLKIIISNDLTINVNQIDEQLMGVLTEALVYYMTTWPGWQRSPEYHSGKLLIKDWFRRFEQYLFFKINFLIKNASKYATELHNENTCKDVAVQTEVNSDKGTAPYTLCIGGPPYVLNNIAFEESNGDVVIRHQEGKPWGDLKLKAFLNWPYVSVNVTLPDISFTRTSTHKFERYITYCDKLTVLPEENHIKYIKKTSDVQEHELVPYSFDFISCYLQHFYGTLKLFPGINLNRLNELAIIFKEFLFDIKEVNVYNCTMCTNTSIGYNIGKCKYIRKNSIEKKKVYQNVIDYYEILTPQVDFTLNYFKAVQEPLHNGKVSFKSINKLFLPNNIKVILDNVNNSCIVYNCTLCSEMFTGPVALNALVQHFTVKHKALRAVKCCKCHKEFEIILLAQQRWVHTCT